MAAANKHDERFRRWQLRAPERTRQLSELLANRLIPALEATGFQKVDCVLGKRTSPVEGSELRFERTLNGCIDVIYVFFDKYSSPRFQVSFSRRSVNDPEAIIRSGHLVRAPSERYHEWGKPRWFPVALWSEARAVGVAMEVAGYLDQVLRFLEVGETGSKISAANLGSAHRSRG